MYHIILLDYLDHDFVHESKLNIGKSEIRSHYVMNVCCFGRKRKPEDHDKEVDNERVNNC